MKKESLIISERLYIIPTNGPIYIYDYRIIPREMSNSEGFTKKKGEFLLINKVWGNRGNIIIRGREGRE